MRACIFVHVYVCVCMLVSIYCMSVCMCVHVCVCGESACLSPTEVQFGVGPVSYRIGSLLTE